MENEIHYIQDKIYSIEGKIYYCEQEAKDCKDLSRRKYLAERSKENRLELNLLKNILNHLVFEGVD